MLTAWGDESGSIPELDPHTYLLAAAMFDDADVPLVRKTMAGLKLHTETKLHWHASSAYRRGQLVDTVNGLPIAALTCEHTFESVRIPNHGRLLDDRRTTLRLVVANRRPISTDSRLGHIQAVEHGRPGDVAAVLRGTAR